MLSNEMLHTLNILALEDPILEVDLPAEDISFMLENGYLTMRGDITPKGYNELAFRHKELRMKLPIVIYVDFKEKIITNKKVA